MRFPLSCADYTWPLLEHRAALRLIQDIGLQAVDIGLFFGATHVRPEVVAEDPRRWAGIVAERTEAVGLTVADVFLTPGPDLVTRTPNHLEATERKAALHMLEETVTFADALGAPGVTVLPGVRFNDEPYGLAIERAAATLRAFVEIAGGRGLSLSVEPHSGSCIDTPERTLELLEATPGLTVTLDPSHFAYEGVDASRMLPLLDRTRHVQLRPGGTGVMQSRVAENEIDFAAIIDGLEVVGYEGYLAMEYVWIDSWNCNRVDNLSETILLRDLTRSLEP